MESKNIWNPIRATMEIAALVALAGDDEVAHSREDSLYESFLIALTAGDVTEAPETARILLSSKTIDFCRWYA